MLLHDFAYVPVPAEWVCARIIADQGEWLSGLAAGAAREGESLRLRVGPIEPLPLLSKTVTLHADQPIVREEATIVPLTWRATGSQGIFPVLNADLEVSALSPQITQLTLRGRYEPPLGLVGQRLDRLLLHRVAEATIRSFMRRLAESLADTVAVDEPQRPSTRVAEEPSPRKSLLRTGVSTGTR